MRFLLEVREIWIQEEAESRYITLMGFYANAGDGFTVKVSHES